MLTSGESTTIISVISYYAEQRWLSAFLVLTQGLPFVPPSPLWTLCYRISVTTQNHSELSSVPVWGYSFFKA